MLEKWIKQRHVRAWHQGTVFAPHLDGFLEEMDRQDFSRHLICRRLCGVTWFGGHLRQHGVHAISDITEAHVKDFLEAQGRERAFSCIQDQRKAVKELLDYLERKGVWIRPPKPEIRGPVAEFLRSLAEERGLVQRSIEPYRVYVHRFMEYAKCNGTPENLARLTAQDVDGFIVKMGHCYSRRTMSSICVCMQRVAPLPLP